MKTNSKKLRASVLAGLLAAALVLTGTFAWRSMSQRTQNKIMDNRNPGGRVHDDFSFTAEVKNKDVYAENFTDKLDGAPIFVRIRLAEYMETGADAGVKQGETGRKAASLVTGAKIESPDTWKVFDPKDADDPFREYWDLTFGGQTVYLPTFNKNKDSLSVEVNGTYEGPNGLFDDEDRYLDYKTYEAGTGYRGTEYYDADDNDIDEYTTGVGGPDGNGGTLGTNYSIKADVEHVALKTLPSLPGFVLMSDWVRAGKPVCNQWVYDDTADVAHGGGWFYWPEPIQPQTATGLLLDNVSQRKTAGEKTYYAIDVTGQFATAFQWGDEGSTADADRGFYLNGFSDTAKALMDQAASVEIGKNDKWYLPQSNGVYKEILNDTGNLGGLVCAGADGLIGTNDDRTDVVYVKDGFTIGSTKYCAYYLKPSAAEPYYRAALPTGKLGANTDARFWLINGTFPTGKVTSEPVTSLVVTSKDNTDQVKQGETLQFTATLTVEAGVTNQNVTWSLAGNEDTTNTTLSDTGLLAVGNETPGTKLTVTATSKLDGRVSDSWEVTVVTDKTVTLDGKEYYVLKTESDNNRALVLSKDAPWWRVMDPIPSTHWPDTELFRWLNDTSSDGLLGQKPELSGVSLVTTTKTRTDYNTTEWETSTGKVFLLSEADVFGKTNAAPARADDYTAGGMLTAPTGGWAVPSGDGRFIGWFLRSPRNSSNSAANVSHSSGGSSNYVDRSAKYGVRPAAWVMLNGVNVATENNATGVVQGNKLQFSAAVVKNMRPVAGQTFTWSVAGGNGGNTDIDANGLLTVDSGETAGTLTVTATAPDGQTKSMTVTVGYKLTANEGETFDDVDGVTYRVLHRDDTKHEALVIREYVLPTEQNFDTDSPSWSGSNIQEYLNGDYYNSLPDGLKEFVKEVTIKTRTAYTGDGFTETTDKVFLLSEADVFGTTQYGSAATADDYTVQVGGAGKQLFTGDRSTRVGKTSSSGSGIHWWLRSPGYDSGYVIRVYDSGTLAYSACGNLRGLRPAFWITIQ